MTGLEVVHVDNHLLACHKPAGVPTVPDESGDESLLAAAKHWVAREFEKPGRVYLGVVHRLDRPVSGVVLFARTSKAASRLSAAFRERRPEKHYWAVVGGLPGDAGATSGRVEQWLVKDRTRNRVHSVAAESPGAQQAVTEWRLLERRAGACLLELRPRTGRPHQLRVALATLGRPLLGDLKYGAREALPDGSVALHARSLEVPRPTGGGTVRFEVPPPGLACWSFDLCGRARDVGAGFEVRD